LEKVGDGNKAWLYAANPWQTFFLHLTRTAKMKKDFITPEQRLIFTKDKPNNLIYLAGFIFLVFLVLSIAYWIAVLK
tara:strand:+ start:365 stop:595 length:231 start_codon:yes stop_codon:yes gene_type:complete